VRVGQRDLGLNGIESVGNARAGQRGVRTDRELASEIGAPHLLAPHPVPSRPAPRRRTRAAPLADAGAGLQETTGCTCRGT